MSPVAITVYCERNSCFKRFTADVTPYTTAVESIWIDQIIRMESGWTVAGDHPNIATFCPDHSPQP